MELLKAGSRPTVRAPERYFTGAVFQDPILEAPEPARMRAITVTFAPGSRTNWHTHPLGQALYITSGVGYIQVWGGEAHEIRAGDVVWFAPDEKHWHGAAPDQGMVHVAIQEHEDGQHVTWLEPVSDEDYATATAKR